MLDCLLLYILYSSDIHQAVRVRQFFMHKDFIRT